MIINYDRKTFILQATGWDSASWDLVVRVSLIVTFVLHLTITRFKEQGTITEGKGSVHFTSSLR
jgi:hypothetical protein